MSYFINSSYQDGKHFVIYDASRVTRPKRGKVRFLGLALLGLSFLLLASFLFPFFWAETRYRLHQTTSSPPVHSLFGELLWLDKKGVLSPADWEFSLIIPKIGLNTKVVSEVDAADEKAYKKALKEGLAHAKGSSFPNQEGMIYIFGHSTNFVWNVKSYNALFYLLGKLKVGDEVNIFYQGRHFTYQVAEKEVVSAIDLSKFNDSDKKRLVLQTCWPPGTTWQRLIIVALPQEESIKLTDL